MVSPHIKKAHSSEFESTLVNGPIEREKHSLIKGADLSEDGTLYQNTAHSSPDL